MSKLLALSLHNIAIEEFHEAIYYDKVIYPWRNRSVLISSGPTCWGYTVEIPDNSYIRTTQDQNCDPEYVQDCREYTLDGAGDCLELIQVVQEDPIRLKCTRYVAFDLLDEEPDCTADVPLDRDFLFHREGDGIVIDGYQGDPECILIPPVLQGTRVLRADLSCEPLPEECHTFIVSEGVKELDMSFYNNFALSRLEIPDSIELLSPPTHVSFTGWFRRQPSNLPVYLGGYYCGSPGHGSGGKTELVLREGTIGVVDTADFQCYWHRIHFPDSVKTIGDFAFFYSCCLEEVHLPSHLEELGCGAFHNCPRLQSLNLPDSLKEPVHAFEECPALQHVSLPSACWNEETNHFGNCPRVEVRRGAVTITIQNEAAPALVHGNLAAYPVQGPLIIAGRKYPSASSLTLHPQEKKGHSIDCYGNPVYFVQHINPSYYTGIRQHYMQKYWFVSSDRGITMITMDHLEENYLIQEGVTAQDVPFAIRRKVPDLFPMGSKRHE